MEEDAGVKAPVTRLRRRLSVEQSEESKSPAVNTPTKKRGGRRAKPELELIDENTPDNTTKKTKKTATKEIKDAVEEKPVTPSRRSTRIKSNTSIVSETAVAIDSPRAKRAARRTSAVGSDSEAPATPVRQTRRTRKDSASSVDKAEASKPATQITEVIVEEPENNERKSISNVDKDNNVSPSNVRKSPRLVEKVKKATPKSAKKNNKKAAATPEKQQDENMPSRKSVDSSLPNSQETNESAESPKEPASVDIEIKNRLSTSSAGLIKDLEVKVTKMKSNNLNKTMSSMNDNNKLDNTKRKRTKSWTTLTLEHESNFYSDNESSKKKIINNIKDPGQLFKSGKSGSGDASINTSMHDKSDKSFSKRKKNNSGNFIVEDIDVSVNKSQNKSQIHEEGAIDSKANNEVLELFKKEPSADLQAMVLIDDDSDSNQGKKIINRCESGDQCVPVVEHTVQIEKEEFSLLSKNQSILNKTKDKSGANLSCEPMDVDETIPESLLVEMENNENNSSKRKSIPQFPDLDKSTKEEKINKSKRKSSISNNLEKSGNENKSTLILSELKDASSNEISNVTKSPQIKNTVLSKTIEDLNVTQENEINKRNISLNCVTTSTPLQQKNLQKLALNANTSIFSPNDSKNIKENLNLSKNNEKLNTSNKNDLSNIEKNPDIKEISTKSEKLNQSKNNASKVKEIDGGLQILDEKNKSLNSSKKNESQKQNESKSDSDDESLNIKRKIKSKSSKRQLSAETDSDDDNDSNDESNDHSNLLDDKASDAGDDYESGDSQSDDEREYMRENEILEKGETLSTEEEFSDDTDYEKDSFVVSSAEEDNELLDGTEDDLSMSDNELKMNAKSKKKYNERKQKEQKNASREMFESRHKLNASNKSSSSDLGKIKKNKKQQLSSSESDSEAETKPRKNNRMRFDSTNEASMLEDKDDVDKKTKTTKRLSASVCEENVENEKEISIANQSIKEVDPLTTVQIKEEPKTPKKENTSIAFINSDEMNMDVDANELTKTQTEIDPLDASANDDDDDDVSLSSDTEIIQNYDSVLEGLSKNSKKKTKTVDISLNLDKKTKKQKSAIVDELNLTQVKSTKKNKKQEVVESKIKHEEHDGSSDSIDLHLLFSEDSNNSEDVQTKEDANEAIIPLKRKDGKMDIRDINNDSSTPSDNTSLNVSLKKNKKRKSKIEENINSNEEQETNVSFFIDTEGTHTSLNMSVDTSIKGKKKKSIQNNNSRVSSQEGEDLSINKDVTDGNNSDDAPLEVSFQKSKKDIDVNEEDQTELILEKSINKSIAKTPGSEKKKKKNKNLQVEEIDDENVADKSLNESLSGKKKKKSISEIQEIEYENINNKSLNASASGKKKNKSLVVEQESEPSGEDTEVQAINVSLIKTPGSQKKKKRVSEIHNTLNENDNSIIMNNSFGKKKNKSINVEEQTATNEEDIPEPSTLNTSLVKTPSSQKKKKRISESLNEVNDETAVLPANNSISKTPNSGKKKKKLSQSINNDQDPEEHLNVSTIKTPGSQKKKSSLSQQENVQESLNSSKIKNPGSQKKNVQQPQEIEVKVELSEAVKETSSKKRKRKASLNTTVEELNCEDGESNVSKKLNESLVGSQKKKLKVSQQSVESIIDIEQKQEECNLQSSGDKKKKKLKKQETYNAQTEIPGTELVKPNRNKRKQREDDDENTVSKVLKQNSFDKQIPRLPDSILSQLDDNHQKEANVPKKPKAVSTTQFLVEATKKRRNKPSNYLEESVYLNDDEIENRKMKKRLQKPKVLPFVPTALTSGSGYTTNFKVNIIPRETKFTAQTSNISNFKEDYILNKKIKRQGTYELYKKNRNIKISKF